MCDRIPIVFATLVDILCDVVIPCQAFIHDDAKKVY